MSTFDDPQRFFGSTMVNSKHPNKVTLCLLYTSLCTGELSAIRMHKCFLCSPFYVKGVSLGYVGRIKT